MGCGQSQRPEIKYPQSEVKWPEVEKRLKVIAMDFDKFSDKDDKDYVEYISGTSRLTSGAPCSFKGLEKLFQDVLSSPEKRNYRDDVIPFMAKLVLLFEEVQPGVKLCYSRSGLNSRVELNKAFVAALIAMGFFCFYPDQTKMLNLLQTALNFNDCFQTTKIPGEEDEKEDSTLSQDASFLLSDDHLMSKLKCILNYFDELNNDKYGLDSGVVTYERRCNYHQIPITADSIQNSSTELCEFTVKSISKLQTMGCETQQVYFLHQNASRDVFSSGCTDDSIKFFICPELLASLLFMEDLLDDEAIVISGFQQFSTYAGRGIDFQYAGTWTENAGRDSAGNFKTTLVALSELSCSPEDQYEKTNLLNEIEKTYFGFSQLKGEFQENGQCTSSAGVTDKWACVDDTKGDVLLKAYIRWISASLAGCPGLTYYISDDDDVENITKMMAKVKQSHKVKDLYEFMVVMGDGQDSAAVTSDVLGEVH